MRANTDNQYKILREYNQEIFIRAIQTAEAISWNAGIDVHDLIKRAEVERAIVMYAVSLLGLDKE